MALEEKDLRILAKFFYKHRNDEAYWTSPLLLQHPEVQSFQLSIGAAESIFEAFEKKGFLKKDGENTVQIGGHDFQKYRFDLAGVGNLREYADIPFYYTWFSERILDRIDKLKTLLTVCVVLVFTSFFEAIFGKLGDDAYLKLSGGWAWFIGLLKSLFV